MSATLAPLPIEVEPWEAKPGTGHEYMPDQWLYRFPNGYGASVVQGKVTYGGEQGKYELAVIVFEGDDWNLTYDTPVTNDVIGWLDISAVAELLAQIAALPSGGAS